MHRTGLATAPPALPTRTLVHSPQRATKSTTLDPLSSQPLADRSFRDLTMAQEDTHPSAHQQDKSESTSGKHDWKTRPPYSIHKDNDKFDVKHEASCHCGKVHYQLSRDVPLDSKLCHCSTCQTQHGEFAVFDGCFFRGHGLAVSGRCGGVMSERWLTRASWPTAAPFQWAAIFHKTDINFTDGHHNLEWCVLHLPRLIPSPPWRPIFFLPFPRTQSSYKTVADASSHRYDPTEKSIEHTLPCKVRCNFCHSPIMDEGRNMILLFPPLIHFKSAEDKKKFQPRCHMFYGQRVIDIPDGLPKWSGLSKICLSSFSFLFSYRISSTLLAFRGAP